MSAHEQAYNEITSVDVPEEEHKAAWTHELLAGAAAFEAMHLYNKKKAEAGDEDNHQLAKELLAGLAAASVDGFAESKGLDWIDRQKAKHRAKEEAEKLYSEQTGYSF
ncbi:uncharacterized protein BYT42DRAFT_542402 [Radiomyces spectabilis]|uniref:uncharacterized protein n=1 Tax=Radiomyces spectabilis TaxID=64574 RepID=UPI00221E8F82|nr:uncharacterized protein BYT42DRAFT_542402 [Radiomyces spectabilis]KAI8394278.1 hypothetical protein BYT42DRAFT_542402 [Radiomyces spectabilis]